MAVVVVGEDGQTFISPPELDAFTYYRDYILVRTYKEFFGLNPVAGVSGWVDYSGPKYWYSAYSGQGQWEGDEWKFDKDQNEVLLLPTGDPPWTKYTSLSYIKLTFIDKYGIGKIRKADLGYLNDDEYMEHQYFDPNNPEGKVIWWDSTAIQNQAYDYFQSIDISQTFAETGDRLEKIEFRLDPPPGLNQDSIPYDFSDMTNRLHYMNWSENLSKDSIFLFIQLFPNILSHALWNGTSWDRYSPLTETSYQNIGAKVAYDEFGHVHYFQSLSGGLFRTSWSLASGFYDINVPFASGRSFVYSGGGPQYTCINDSDGYTHVLLFTRDPNIYRLDHYYQDASGWHYETLYTFGLWAESPYSMSYVSPASTYYDQYDRLHCFFSGRYVGSGDNGYCIVDFTNQLGSWEMNNYFPFGVPEPGGLGTTSSVEEMLTAWVGTNGKMYYIAASFELWSPNPGIKLFDKEWSASEWNETVILELQRGFRGFRVIVDDDIIHIFGRYDTASDNLDHWWYLKYRISTNEIEKEDLHAYPNRNYLLSSQIRVDPDSMHFYIRDGKPYYTYVTWLKRFVEVQILE